jgi:apolipoprotein N-acyltransferase
MRGASLLQGAASGFLLYLSTLGGPWSFLAWVGLVPALLGRGTSVDGAVRLLVTAVFFYGLGLRWIWLLAVPGFVVVVLVMSAYAVVFGAMLPRLSRGHPVLFPLLAAALWTGLDHLRGLLLGGFPWLCLGHGQAEILAIAQIADLFGVAGVTFLIVLVNAALAHAAGALSASPRSSAGAVALAGGALAVTLGYGAWRLSTLELEPGPRLAAIQAQIDVLGKHGRMSQDEIVLVHDRLSRQAARENPRPDLIVWSETMYPAVTGEDRVLEPLRRLARQYAIPMLVGAEAYLPGPGGEGFIRRNRALFVPLEGPIATYDKVHLVPFGEYVPLRSVLPFRETIESFLREKMGGVPDITSGTDTPLFDLETAGGRYRFGALICYDSVFARLLLCFDLSQTDFFVSLSNDGWYEGTEEPWQMHSMTVFRAIETRRSVFRATNLGISAAISPLGRAVILPALDLRIDRPPSLESQAAMVPLCRTRSFYAIIGDAFAWLCLFLGALAAVFRGRISWALFLL